MDNAQETNVTNENDITVDDNQKQLTYLLTQKVDELTGNQMKQMEVMKMEDCLTIRMLEREYFEGKRYLNYSQRKLEEAKKKSSVQTGTINELSQDNLAMVEKFNELKKFQNDIMINNINNEEKRLFTCNNKINKLSNTLKLVDEKEEYSKRLNESIFEKKNKLNIEGLKEMDEKQKICNNLSEISMQSKQKIQILKEQLNKEMINIQPKDLIDKKKERVIELEADKEALQDKSKQEENNLVEKKTNLLKDSKNIKTNLNEKNTSISKIESELQSIEKNLTIKKETYEKLIAETEKITNEAQKKRAGIEKSKKSFDENLKIIEVEQNKINDELETAKSKFSKNEDKMHTELKTLMQNVEEKKKLIRKLEAYQIDYEKLKEAILTMKKELSNDKEFQENLKKSNDELKKYEQIPSSINKKLSNYYAKLKELQEQKNIIEQKLETADKDKKNTVNDQRNSAFFKSSQFPKKATQAVSSQDKIIDSSTKNELDLSSGNVKNSEPVIKAKPPSPKKKPYTFDFDDSDSSEDEYKIRNQTPKKVETLLTPIKKTVPDAEQDSNNLNKSSEENKLSQNDKVFDELLSQKPSLSRNSKDTDVFKVPHAYATPIKKKYGPLKKY